MIEWLRRLRPECGLVYQEHLGASQRKCTRPWLHRGRHRGPLLVL